MSPKTKKLLASVATGLLLADLAVILAARPFLTQNQFWLALGLGTAIVALLFSVWRCHHCGGFIGPVNAKFCRNCRSPVEGTKPSAPVVADSAGLTTATTKLQRTAVRIRRLGNLRRRISVGFVILSAIAAVGAYAKWHDLTLLPSVFFIGSLVGWCVTYAVGSVFHNFLVIQLRCPSCNTSLVNNYVGFCPKCSYRLPDWNEMTKAA